VEVASKRHASRPALREAVAAELEEVAFSDAVVGKPRDRHEVGRRGGLAAEKPQGRNERVKPHVTSVTTVRIFGKIPRLAILGRLPA
jgi:hypothetical protein